MATCGSGTRADAALTATLMIVPKISRFLKIMAYYERLVRPAYTIAHLTQAKKKPACGQGATRQY